MKPLSNLLRMAAFSLVCACVYGALFLAGVFLNGEISALVVPLLFEQPGLLLLAKFPFGTLAASLVVFFLGKLIAKSFAGSQKWLVASVSLLPALMFLALSFPDQNQKAEGSRWLLALLILYSLVFLFSCKEGKPVDTVLTGAMQGNGVRHD